MNELSESNDDPDRYLGIIIVDDPESGDCELALTWIYTDIEIDVPDPLSSLVETH